MSENQTKPDFSKILGALLENPSLLSGLVGTLGKAMADAGEGKETQPNGTATPDLSSLLGGDTATLVSSILSSPKAAEDNESKEKKDEEENESKKSIEAFSPVAHILPKLLSGKTTDFSFKQNKQRRCLLEALRPFLSPERCRTLDLMLGFLDVWALLSEGK